MREMTLEERFAAVDKPADGCWLWKWAKNGAGRANYRGRSAPRLIYEMMNKCSVPDNLGVLHSCDNPACVNPAHLRVGTQQENMAECSAKGRRNPASAQKPGEHHSLAKLTQADVEKIKSLAQSGLTHSAIAAKYPVQRRQISRIVSGERWSAAQ